MHDLMRIALGAAHSSPRAVRPNPRVGCAVRCASGEVVSGFHERYGGPHAEVVALANCAARGLSTRGATVAVTLEPCAHFGKTPPCADALIKAEVARVIVGVEDPFPDVQGRGIRRLREAGIEVEVGIERAECEAVNREWLYSQRHHRSFVTLKLATSLDGLWTSESGGSRWITGPGARARVHDLRARVDVLVTGRGTVERDNPRLTARLGERELPDQPRVYVLSRTEPTDLSRTRLANRAESVVTDDLAGFLGELHREGSHDVMIEAGPRLSHAFLAQELVNEIWLFQGPRFLGGNGRRWDHFAAGRLPGLELELLDVERFGEGDLLLKLRPLIA